MQGSIAYIYWAFCKGFRYAAELPAKNGYAVHWLREHAMRASSSDQSLVTPGKEGEFGLFPWGEAVFELFRALPAGQNEKLSECLSELRTYSKTALSSLWDEIREVKGNLDPDESPRNDLLFSTPVEAVWRRTYDTLENGLIHAFPSGMTVDGVVRATMALGWVLHFAIPMDHLLHELVTPFAWVLRKRIPSAWLANPVAHVDHRVTILRYGRYVRGAARDNQSVQEAVKRFMDAQNLA